jgi:phenylalanyl-tRNA synthetase alpha chain
VRLSRQAIQILEYLKQDDSLTVEQLTARGFDQSLVNRAALELEEEGLVEVREETEIERTLTETGEKVVEKGSPEHRLIQRVEEGDRSLSNLQDLNLDVALGKARENEWIEIEGGAVSLTRKGRDYLEEDEIREQLQREDFNEQHEERGLVETTEHVRRTLGLTEEGQDLDLEDVEEDFNVEARTQTPSIGKKHFYREIIQYARQKWIEMGFQEMKGDFVVPSLLNFDALYTPQDHPARELQDTFFMSQPEKTDLSGFGDKVEHIKKTHQDGWLTGGDGWGYEDWSEEEAARNVLRTHTTAVSARRIHEMELNQEDLPKKFFTIARNFRNETVDRFHLAEFNQTEGIVVGEDLSFTNLKGYITEFFEKMGYDEFRLIPSYYPYTEMSVEVQIWDEDDEEWVGLGGAGMFRPEVVKPLLGFEATVLAWGLGLGRIAMKAAELEDLRELYRNDIENLEQTPQWSPE